MSPNDQSSTDRNRRGWSLAVVPWLLLGGAGGCYDGGELVDQARSAALVTRLAEVDLGTYRTTLPRDRDTNSAIQLEMHIFGTVPRYSVPAIENELEAEQHRLRHETLTALRKSTSKELTEPDFTQLRARIELVVNGILADAPVKAVGIDKVRLTYR